MNVLLVIPSLPDPGGAQRVITMMANHWVETRDWDVTVATFDAGERPPFYALSSQVKHEPLNIIQHPSKVLRRAVTTKRRIKAFEKYRVLQHSSSLIGRILNSRRRVHVLRQYFHARNPDVVISFLSGANILVLLSVLRTEIPVIVSERNNPANQPLGTVMEHLRKWLYPRASGVVCQTQQILDFFGPGLRRNGVVIPNPVMQPDDDVAVPEIPLPDGKLLFAIGGMAGQKMYQKGFDLLVPVFGNLAQRHKEWSLMILGDGSERDALQRKAEECGLSGRVYLPGNVKNVHSLLAKGDLFVLSSRYEGFPNALCEAMACGLPAVSFDCPTGPRDIIRHGIDGLLIPGEDASALEEGLSDLMSDKEMREKMGAKAREVVDRFSPEKVMKMWEELVVRCVQER